MYKKKKKLNKFSLVNWRVNESRPIFARLIRDLDPMVQIEIHSSITCTVNSIGQCPETI